VSVDQLLAAGAALVLGAGLVAARRSLGRAARAIAALALAALLAVAAGLVEIPDTTGVLEQLAGSLGAWTYALVAGLAFLETAAFVGLVAPGETTVVLGGALAARGDVDLVALIALTWAAAAAGDLASFALGRRLGRPFLVRHGPRFGLSSERLERVERFVARWGGAGVLIGRFAGLVRATAPFLVAASGLSLRRFLPYSIAGTAVWSALFASVGYAFAGAVESAARGASRIALAAALLAGVVLLWRARRSRGSTAAPADVRGAPSPADPHPETRAGGNGERPERAPRPPVGGPA